MLLMSVCSTLICQEEIIKFCMKRFDFLNLTLILSLSLSSASLKLMYDPQISQSRIRNPR